MNMYLAFILFILLVEYVLTLIVEVLNVKHASPTLPEEFAGVYDAGKYSESQNYLKDTTRFSLIRETVVTLVTVSFILAGGFNLVDQFARRLVHGPIPTGLIFSGILTLVSYLLGLPFSVYRTFVIEAKYGFNKTTVKTFVSDIIKSLLLGGLIGSILMTGIIWFFLRAGSFAWAYCWLAVMAFQLFLAFIAPVVILPLFNKFIPLEEGELKTAIETYARSQRFALRGIFKMDASRRSTKSNAFFVGFGRFRRIALFDTLIQKHTTSELVSVLAHEIGHYKKKHFIKALALSFITTGLMFFVLQFFLNNQKLFDAFRMQYISIYGSIVFFSFLYSPINMILAILHNIMSRHHEYEADAFTISTYQQPEAFISALKKLSVANFSNLTPHPLKVFLDYTHPPVLKRIEAIREKKTDV
ncbi:MAG: M48 family metallopeptidase [Candidatus Omnitrophota bacterium]